MSSGDCKHCPYFHTAKPDDYIRNKWIIKDKINLIFTNNTDKFKYDNENNMSICKISEIIDYTEQDINEEFDDKLQELKGCIDKVAWYAHARDHNKALKALDRIIYAVSRDLDE